MDAGTTATSSGGGRKSKKKNSAKAKRPSSKTTGKGGAKKAKTVKSTGTTDRGDVFDFNNEDDGETALRETHFQDRDRCYEELRQHHKIENPDELHEIL